MADNDKYIKPSEKKYIDYLTQLAKQGTKAFNIRGEVFTEEESFDIVAVMFILNQNPYIVANYIIPLLEDLMKQYNKDIIKISKTIVSDIPQIREDENMRRFTLYVLGKNFESSYNKMSIDEQQKYILNIAPGFGIYSEDRFDVILEYLTDLTLREAARGETDPANTIKRIAVSDFRDYEIDYMILLRGLF